VGSVEVHIGGGRADLDALRRRDADASG